MAIHIDHIPSKITKFEQAFSHMLLKLIRTLYGAFGKETVLCGGRANERQPRQLALQALVVGRGASHLCKKRFFAAKQL